MSFDVAGAASGAGTGAVYGGMYGGAPGAAVGAVAGGVLGAFNKKKKRKKVSTLDPTQQRLYDQKAQALEGGGGPMADIYGQFNPEELQQLWQQSYAQPAYQNYKENIVPTVTGQFRGSNLQNSSYMGSSLAREGSRVQSDLDAKLQQMLYQGKESNMNRRSQGYNDILNMNTFDYQEPGASPMDGLLNQAGGHAINMMTDMLSQRNGIGKYAPQKAATPSPGVGG